MKKIRFVKLGILGILLSLFSVLFYFKNHVRLILLRRFPVVESNLIFVDKIDEKSFSIDIFETQRKFNSKLITKANSYFKDKILVVKIPVEKYTFRNTVLDPVSKDRKNSEADFYFNTLFFYDDFSATTGIIEDKRNLTKRRPKKNRIGIDKKGRLINFQTESNAKFNDVIQAPFTLNSNSKTKVNFRTLNFRHFVGFQNNELIYISGLNKSLISWMDVKLVMKKLDLKNVIALDGGASLDYSFKGENNLFQFSSIPLREFWFNSNSPYYLEGFIK